MPLSTKHVLIGEKEKDDLMIDQGMKCEAKSGIRQFSHVQLRLRRTLQTQWHQKHGSNPKLFWSL